VIIEAKYIYTMDGSDTELWEIHFVSWLSVLIEILTLGRVRRVSVYRVYGSGTVWRTQHANRRLSVTYESVMCGHWRRRRFVRRVS